MRAGALGHTHMYSEMASEHSEQGLELEETLAELEHEYRDGELYKQ